MSQANKEGEDRYQAIARHFKAGTDKAGVKVPRPPTVGRGDSDDGLFMVPVSIRYRYEAK